MRDYVPIGRVTVLPVRPITASMGREARKTPHFVKEWREHRDMTQDQLADKVGLERSVVTKIESGARPLMQNRLNAFAKALRIKVTQLYQPPPSVDGLSEEHPEISVDSDTNQSVASNARGTRTGKNYEPLTDEAPIIGRVQAGAWTEALQLPEGEWKWMALPRDDRFPGVQQYIWQNVGESMNRVCPNGGYWAGVMFRDLVGQGPSIGQYVIVERVRKDGLVEATAKLFKIGADGKPWLHPDSTDPTFKPIPLDGDGEVEEIRIIARVTRAITPLL